MSGENSFLPQAIERVQQAIAADNNKEYEKAMNLYKESLERFMLALKYMKNPSTKKLILKRVDGYMLRAEKLKKMLDAKEKADSEPAADAPVAQGGGGGASKKDKEDKALANQLSSVIVADKPNVKWTDVAGLDAAKRALKEAVILPARFPQLFTGKRRPWKGILLYGPPGTGKSYLAKAVATEADSTFLSVSSSDLVSKWQGESEKLVKTMFQIARDKKPAIIFIDEIDSLCGSRAEGENEASRRIKTEFLVQMQGVGKTHDGILVLGATNVPWEIDAAMRRRFEKRVYIPLPESYARSYMFKLHMGNTMNDLGKWATEGEEDTLRATNPNYIELGSKTGGFSGSDINVAVREALMQPVRVCQDAKFFHRYGHVVCQTQIPRLRTLFQITDKKVMQDEMLKELKALRLTIPDSQLTSMVMRHVPADGGKPLRPLQAEIEAILTSHIAMMHRDMLRADAIELEAKTKMYVGKCFKSKDLRVWRSKWTQLALSPPTASGPSLIAHEKNLRKVKDLINTAEAAASGDKRCRPPHKSQFEMAQKVLKNTAIGGLGRAFELTDERLCKFTPCDAGSDGAIHMGLYDMDSEDLQVPDVTMKNFQQVLSHAKGSVADDELTKFIKWTEEFGEEGA